MSNNTSQPAKTVFWFNDGKTPNVADSLDKNKEITLHRLDFKGPEADNWGAMSASHAYCITSTRQEVPELAGHGALVVNHPLDKLTPPEHFAAVEARLTPDA